MEIEQLLWPFLFVRLVLSWVSSSCSPVYLSVPAGVHSLSNVRKGAGWSDWEHAKMHICSFIVMEWINWSRNSIQKAGIANPHQTGNWISCKLGILFWCICFGSDTPSIFLVYLATRTGRLLGSVSASLCKQGSMTSVPGLSDHSFTLFMRWPPKSCMWLWCSLSEWSIWPWQKLLTSTATCILKWSVCSGTSYSVIHVSSSFRSITAE